MVEPLSPEVLAAYRRMGMRPDGIADLSSLGLTPEQKAARRKRLGCSALPILAKAKPEALVELARWYWGEVEEDSLDDKLNVQGGQWMEPFILAWAERQMGFTVTRRGEVVHAARRPWLACTLDGFAEDYQGKGSRILQAKFFSPWFKIEDAIEQKRWQVLGECYCTGADGGLLLIYNQGSKLEAWDFEPEPTALADILGLADEFWQAVQDKRLPAVLPTKVKASAVVRATRVGELDLSGSNEWGAAAADFLANREANIKFEASQDSLKKLTPVDKERAYGHGVEVTVSKSGAKTVKAIETKAAPKAAKDAA